MIQDNKPSLNLLEKGGKEHKKDQNEKNTKVFPSLIDLTLLNIKKRASKSIINKETGFLGEKQRLV